MCVGEVNRSLAGVRGAGPPRRAVLSSADISGVNAEGLIVNPPSSETQGGPGTHCCPRKDVGGGALPTALCSAQLALLFCS